MPATFTLDIVTPDRVVLSDQAVSMQAPGVCGSFGVLPGHAPLLSELETGEMRYKRETGEEIRLAVSGGFIQVFNNNVTVLADTAERSGEIDPDRARAEMEAARRNLESAQDQLERARAEEALKRAENRLRVTSG
jgi:F-type H+-transporting ATPase subunit epsilon